jgi:hypothetical protein
MEPHAKAWFREATLSRRPNAATVQLNGWRGVPPANHFPITPFCLSLFSFGLITNEQYPWFGLFLK